MSVLASPWWLVALAVPALLVLYAWHYRRSLPTLRLSRLGVLRRKRPTLRARLGPLPWVLRSAALVLGVVALARPQWGTRFEEVVTQGVDIVMTLDISGSMHAEDLKPKNRLAVAKEVFREFIRSRKHDRIGMVVFAGRAVTQCPLTTDQRILDDLVDAVDFDTVRADGTAIGMAIATSVNRLRTSQAPSKVIVLLSDGVNNAGPVDPLTAADMAKSLGVKIHAVGVGGLVPVSYFQRTPNGTQRFQAEPLDERQLKEIAARTGGYYFRATDRDQLKESLKRIDALEKSDVETREYTSYEERFMPLALVALILVGLETLLEATLLRRLP